MLQNDTNESFTCILFKNNVKDSNIKQKNDLESNEYRIASILFKNEADKLAMICKQIYI